MAGELIINASLPETRIALMENGEIQELLIERASGKGIVGNIYKGRVTRVLPGMQAAFVDIGLEKAAFLYVDDVYVHSEIWEEEEGSQSGSSADLPDENGAESGTENTAESAAEAGAEAPKSEGSSSAEQDSAKQGEAVVGTQSRAMDPAVSEGLVGVADQAPEGWENPENKNLRDQGDFGDLQGEEEDDDEGEEGGPVGMGPPPASQSAEDGDSDDDSSQSGNSENSTTSEGKKEGSRSKIPAGTLAPEESPSPGELESKSSDGSSDGSDESQTEAQGDAQAQPRRRHRRGRRGGRFRRRPASAEGVHGGVESSKDHPESQQYPENYREQMADSGNSSSDRSALAEDQQQQKEMSAPEEPQAGRPEETPSHTERSDYRAADENRTTDRRADFRAHRSRDRRIRAKAAIRPVRTQVNIQELLKEGQEILVQVAKDPIATKGARLTCHISLPGRHLVCMPTIDHVGVSRRIERDDERRRLREYVERNRPKNLGFIVRTASGKQSEKRIKQDIEYLTRLWTEIKEKAATLTAPALVYEDLNSVLRAIRDWVTEEIDKVIVDSRYHFNEVQRFVSHFMPPLKQKIELYHGDIPIFDAYGISTELSRSLERKVWLKSGGYIVIDQAEALVAIDVNTGRYVGKKNLEDTILKTNLEAVQEIAYQLRLRNCGGIIILDLIDMEKDENKQRVYRALEDALARDRARPTIMKISELGLVEMTRKRTRDTIIRTLCESCSHCEGKGFVKSKQTVAYEVMREVEREGIERDIGKILVQAHPDVIDILAIDERETLDQLERRYRKQIYLQAVHDFHPEQFEVSADKRERPEKSREHSSERHSERHDRHGDRNSERHPDQHDRGRKGYRQSSASQGHYGGHASPPSQGLQGTQSSSETAAEQIPDSRIPDSLKLEKLEAKASSSISAASAGEGQLTGQASVVMGEESAGAEISGNAQGPSTSAPAGNQSNKPVSSDESADNPYDEEDRLAFLRAQAAQDAALARLNAGGSGHAPRTSGNEGGGRGDRSGGRRNPRGHRTGKFRRMNDRNGHAGHSSHTGGGRGRNSKAFGYNGQHTSKWTEPAPAKDSDSESKATAPAGSTAPHNNSSDEV